MKFVTFKNNNGLVRAGWLRDEGVVDMHSASQGKLPDNMKDFLWDLENYLPIVNEIKDHANPDYTLGEVQLLAPLPNPTTFRDFVSFETHMKNASARTGLPLSKEWYEIPVFYFSNPHNMRGTGAEIPRPKKSSQMDYELELACIIGKQGSNIKASEAEDYIFGYTILNDWTARDLQAQEMKVHLGPAKGKDFATSIGPYIVTKDELEPYRVGDRFDLRMTAKINGKIISDGNFKDIYYSFAQMIERASEEVTLYPGDLIGSGTVGFGCLLEHGPEVHRWLEPGDEVELEITHLGRLTNKII